MHHFGVGLIALFRCLYKMVFRDHPAWARIIVLYKKCGMKYGCLDICPDGDTRRHTGMSRASRADKR
jgi:hypothetical protein